MKSETLKSETPAGDAGSTGARANLGIGWSFSLHLQTGHLHLAGLVHRPGSKTRRSRCLSPPFDTWSSPWYSIRENVAPTAGFKTANRTKLTSMKITSRRSNQAASHSPQRTGGHVTADRIIGTINGCNNRLLCEYVVFTGDSGRRDALWTPADLWWRRRWSPESSSGREGDGQVCVQLNWV